MIFDSDSPGELALQAAARFRELEIEAPEFLDGLVAAWMSGGRDTALELFWRHRDGQPAQERMDKLQAGR